MKKITIVYFFLMVFPFCVFSLSIDNYFIEKGMDYFNKGHIERAKKEFEKALMVNSSNEKAKEYLRKIRERKIKESLDLFSSKVEEKRVFSKKENNEEKYFEKEPKLSSKEKKTNVKFRGEYQIGLGVEKGDFLWKKANFDLNEENWRILSDAAFNRRENTFDPAIFSQLKFEIDYPTDTNWSFHTFVDISPWSFIGKSNKLTLTGAGGDTAEIELKYWANTGYVINETVYTQLNGDSFAIPEIKVVDGKISSTSITSLFSNVFTIPELEIHREFWPLRELWFDYNAENLNLKIFPVGMEDRAYTSDDPLGLSNHHIYWEESQWLVKWQPGHFNSGSAAQDFFKGWWDDSLVYSVRDSAGVRLTSLRGVSLNLNSTNSLLDFTFASPKELWQDYEEFDTFIYTLRGKYFPKDGFSLGFIYASKNGYNDSELDAFNHCFGIDLKYNLSSNTQILTEVATSRSEYDRSSEEYKSKKRGNSFHFSIINSSREFSEEDYFSINPEEKIPFYKLKLSFTHMDEGFESALASYHETRDDSFWGRHLTFKKPFKYYYVGLYYPSLTWDQVNKFKIGDGIDYGRDVITFRIELENLLDEKMDALFDIRNVHATDGKYIENVSRLETTYRVTPKLTAKFLGIYHDLPPTVKNVDPFIVDPDTQESYQNTYIEDGKDPSLKTICLGAKYDFFDWLDLSLIWEHSNDTTLAYDNFPRGFSWTSFSTYYEYDKKYRKEIYGLNYVNQFPLPPYPYFDIFKVGMGIRPKDNLEIYLDYTYNEYKWAQIIDDNMNHFGIEVAYFPLKKLGLYLRYAYIPKVFDISELNDNKEVRERSHQYVFSEIRLRIDKESELVAQYGVGSTAGIGTSTYTPFGGGVPTLDTQHIFRIYYHKKF
jgi:hypothetical protein